MASRHWLYFAGFALSGISAVVVGLVGLFDALSVLSGGPAYGEEFLLLAMLGEAAEWIVLGLVLVLLAAVFLTATVVSVLRNTSIHRSDRLVSLVEWLEREYPVLRAVDASERVEPTNEDRRARLKEQFVAGEIGDEEFERRMERLVDDGPSDAGTRTDRSPSLERDR